MLSKLRVLKPTATLPDWQHHLTSNVSDDEYLELPEDFIILEQCSQCSNFRYPLVRYCSAEGHGYCENCAGPHCFRCGEDVPMEILRIRSGREVDGKMVFPCWYEFLGCTVTEEDMDVPHEQECSYGEITCPYHHCKDKTVRKKNIARHIFSYHRYSFPVPQNLVPVEIFFMHKKTFTVFIFTIIEDDDKKAYRFSVTIVASNPAYNNKYTYKMKVHPVTSGDGDSDKPEKQFESTTELYSRGHFAEQTEQKTLNIPYDEAKHYYVRSSRKYRAVVEEIKLAEGEGEAAGNVEAGNEAERNEPEGNEEEGSETDGDGEGGNEAGGDGAGGNEGGNEAAENPAAGNEEGNNAAGNDAAGNKAGGNEAGGNEAAGNEAGEKKVDGN